MRKRIRERKDVLLRQGRGRAFHRAAFLRRRRRRRDLHEVRRSCIQEVRQRNRSDIDERIRAGGEEAPQRPVRRANVVRQVAFLVEQTGDVFKRALLLVALCYDLRHIGVFIVHDRLGVVRAVYICSPFSREVRRQCHYGRLVHFFSLLGVLWFFHIYLCDNLSHERCICNTLLFQTFRRRFLLPEYVHDLPESRIVDLGYNNQFARPLRYCVPGAADGRAFFHDVSFSVVLSVFGETTISWKRP
nr:MAG TPA: hypothetical protein [Caudoviricetes sp.]